MTRQAPPVDLGVSLGKAMNLQGLILAAQDITDRMGSAPELVPKGSPKLVYMTEEQHHALYAVLSAAHGIAAGLVKDLDC
jgi:hypothetical protein